MLAEAVARGVASGSGTQVQLVAVAEIDQRCEGAPEPLSWVLERPPGLSGPIAANVLPG